MSPHENPTNGPAEPSSEPPDPHGTEDIDGDFEKIAEQAETEAALEQDPEGSFPTSDPPSSWAGPDVEPERPSSEEPEEQSRS
jgi:hypothetical protein